MAGAWTTRGGLLARTGVASAGICFAIGLATTFCTGVVCDMLFTWFIVKLSSFGRLSELQQVGDSIVITRFTAGRQRKYRLRLF